MNKPKPFSQASENNKRPILNVLREYFTGSCKVVEIGAGTGQHAVFFAEQLPQLTWQPTDRMENIDGIKSWLAEAALDNLMQPLVLDVNRPWPVDAADHVFSANTAHIMSWDEVVLMFQGVARLLGPGGCFCLYGPFNYHGEYTSDSNAEFDAFLKARDPLSGLRDFEALSELAGRHNLTFLADHEMPANNRCLVWQR